MSLVAKVNTEGFSNHITKTITITSNDTSRPQNQLIVSFVGNVVDRQPYQTPVSDVYDASYVLLDVRDPAAYAAGHLAGALSLPASQAAALAGALPAGALVIFYDQSGASATLAAVTQALHGGGVAAVYALRGGLDLWQKSYDSQRVMSGAAAPWQFVDVAGARAYSTSGTVQQYDITQLLSDCVLIDIRSASAFAAGHLAGAVNLSESAVGGFVETLPRWTPVVVYSADGVDSDRVIYSLWMHGSRAQSLLGGLAEWQRQHGNTLVVTSSG